MEMGGFGARQIRERRRRPAGGRHSQEAGSETRENDMPIARPRCPPAGFRFADGQWRAACYIHAQQLVPCEESDGLAIRGPKWRTAIFRSGQPPRGAIERLNPKRGLSVDRDGINDGPPIG